MGDCAEGFGAGGALFGFSVVAHMMASLGRLILKGKVEGRVKESGRREST